MTDETEDTAAYVRRRLREIAAETDEERRVHQRLSRAIARAFERGADDRCVHCGWDERGES